MLKGIIREMNAEDEKKSWEVATEKVYRLNIIIDGMGLNREFPALAEKDRFYNGMGKTEDEVMAMVEKAKKKGLKPTLHLFERTIRRLV